MPLISLTLRSKAVVSSTTGGSKPIDSGKCKGEPSIDTYFEDKLQMRKNMKDICKCPCLYFIIKLCWIKTKLREHRKHLIEALYNKICDFSIFPRANNSPIIPCAHIMK
ncbi:hypothetical protein Glove_386g51 [Diversispora epigaea]|uniref:Uncharacterized protein n=1 Tax=Diversispora epigaea TaxID=1348612 RepID=A0A397H777_9GLOM|nr:hypothetical protein Glove_386g51 [Diversispora epigaea]